MTTNSSRMSMESCRFTGVPIASSSGMSTECRISSLGDAIDIRADIDTCRHPNVMTLRLDMGSIGRWTYSSVSGNAIERHVLGDEHWPMVLRARLTASKEGGVDTFACVRSVMTGERRCFMNETNVHAMPCKDLLLGVLPSQSLASMLMVVLAAIMLGTMLMTSVILCRRYVNGRRFDKGKSSRRGRSSSRRALDLSAIGHDTTIDGVHHHQHRVHRHHRLPPHSTPMGVPVSADESGHYLLPNDSRLYVIDEQPTTLDRATKSSVKRTSTFVAPPPRFIIIGHKTADTQTSTHSLDTGIASHSPQSGSDDLGDGRVGGADDLADGRAGGEAHHLAHGRARGEEDHIDVTVEDVTELIHPLGESQV